LSKDYLVSGEGRWSILLLKLGDVWGYSAALLEVGRKYWKPNIASIFYERYFS